MFIVGHKKETVNKWSEADCKVPEECRHPTFRSCVSIPGRIMMTDTMVPSNRKKENTSRVMVELLEEGQQPHRRHGAEPHKQEACEEGEEWESEWVRGREDGANALKNILQITHWMEETALVELQIYIAFFPLVVC